MHPASYKILNFKDHLTVRVIKQYVDGALAVRGAWLIEPGKLADIVVLSKNIMHIPKEEIMSKVVHDPTQLHLLPCSPFTCVTLAILKISSTTPIH
jgi:hypothetical protein